MSPASLKTTKADQTAPAASPMELATYLDSQRVQILGAYQCKPQFVYSNEWSLGRRLLKTLRLRWEKKKPQQLKLGGESNDIVGTTYLRLYMTGAT